MQAASAEMILSRQKISTSGMTGFATAEDLKKWSAGANVSVHAVCAEVSEIPNSFICSFKSKIEMNDSLIRIGFFTGTADGIPKGTLISNIDPKVDAYKKMIGGHTLTSDDISLFGHAASIIADSQKKLNSLEADFFATIISNIHASKPDAKYAVIAFANESENTELIVRHEISHTKYYLEPNYKEVVMNFWKNSVSDSDKDEIRSILGKTYNAEDDNIIIDEFQAYLMQGEGRVNQLEKFIPKYKLQLLRHLDQL